MEAGKGYVPQEVHPPNDVAAKRRTWGLKAEACPRMKDPLPIEPSSDLG